MWRSFCQSVCKGIAKKGSFGYALTAARILAAEVERLRAAIQRAEDAEKQLLEVAQIVHENSHPQQLRARLFNLLMRHMPDCPKT